MIIFILFIFAYFAFPFFGIAGYIGLPIYLLSYLVLSYLKWKFGQFSHFWRIVFSAMFLLTLALSFFGIFFVYDYLSLCHVGKEACFYQLLLHR